MTGFVTKGHIGGNLKVWWDDLEVLARPNLSLPNSMLLVLDSSVTPDCILLLAWIQFDSICVCHPEAKVFPWGESKARWDPLCDGDGLPISASFGSSLTFRFTASTSRSKKHDKTCQKDRSTISNISEISIKCLIQIRRMRIPIPDVKEHQIYDGPQLQSVSCGWAVGRPSSCSGTNWCRQKKSKTMALESEKMQQIYTNLNQGLFQYTSV